MNKYTVYIPSRGRAGIIILPKILSDLGINFFIAVEPQEAELYSKHYGSGRILVMAESDQGVAYARNFIKEHSAKNGEAWHWQMDDNIKSFMVLKEKKQKSNGLENIQTIENYADQHGNISHIGMAYHTWAFGKKKEMSINKSPASCFLVNNSVPISFRKGVPVDIDYTLQVLSKGYCTVVFEKILIEKPGPLKMKGGCTEIEYSGDKRFNRSLLLKKYWPDFIDIKFKYGRYGLVVKQLGKTFKSEPIKKW